MNFNDLIDTEMISSSFSTLKLPTSNPHTRWAPHVYMFAYSLPTNPRPMDVSSVAVDQTAA